MEVVAPAMAESAATLFLARIFRAMLDVIVLRAALSTLSTMFGSLGVFLVYLSFMQPALGAHAVIFLTIALAILRSSPQR